jgi:molecular chaperone GrpE (heat shock protein)
MPSKAVSAARGAGTTAVAEPPPGRTAKPVSGPVLPAQILAKAEANIAAAIESLNNQMNTAMATMTELAVAGRARGEDYLRTAPLDRATATFQRLVGEVLDDHLVEMLPTLIALRGEMADKVRAAGHTSDHEFFRRGTEMLDQVLSSVGVNQYDARPGEAFDPLIHMAVGETRRDDLTDGAVAEFLQPGFRTARGKIVAPAKVKVNRR